MNLLTHAVSVVLIVVLGASAVMDLRMHPQIVATMTTLKVPSDRIRLLGLVKLAAVVGLLLGFAVPSMTTITSVCLCAYFAIAVATHSRVKDSLRNTAPAVVLLVVSGFLALVAFAR